MTSGIKPAEARPIRTCVGCGRRDEPALMLRLKAGGSGELLLAAAQSGGRSAYVHQNPDCLARLPKTRLLRRSLRAEIARPQRQALADSLLVGASTSSSPSSQSMKPEA